MSNFPAPSQLTNQSRISVLLRTIVTLLALSLMGYLIWKEDWGQIFKQSEKVFGWPLIWAGILMAGSRVFTILRWHVLLKINEKQLPFSEIMKISFGGLFGANFLPSTVGGDIIRLTGGMKKGLGGSFTAASLIVDRLIGLVGMLLFLPIGLFVVLPQSSSELGNASTLAAFPLIEKIWKKIQNLLKQVFAALALWSKKPTTLIYSLVFSVLHMFMLFGGMWILLSASGEQISFWQIGGLWTFIYFVTLIPISINGLGIQEIGITYVFTNFGGVDESNALLLALLVRILIMLLSLPGAFFVSDLLPNKINKNLI